MNAPKRTILTPVVAFAVVLPIVALASAVAPRTAQTPSLPSPALLERQGGALTVYTAGANAFSLPAPNATAAHRHAFVVGNSLFNENWVASPASVKTRQGLGPLFNAQSCSSCHFKDGRGAPPEKESDPLVGLLLRVSLPGRTDRGAPLPVPRYGDQIQHRAIPGVPAEARIRIARVRIAGTYPDGTSFELEKPRYEILDPAYGPLPKEILVSPRVAPPVHGLGLLEAIPEDRLLAHADPDDANGDGISGRPNRVWDVRRKTERLGRFGWKANQPDVAQQNVSAFLGDMGITSPVLAGQNCADGQVECAKAFHLDRPEIDDESLKQTEIYAKLLAVPAARDTSDARFGEGLAVFRSLGCNGCHVESHVTGEDTEIPELSRQLVRPYSDLLLHDMGEELADGRPDFQADGREWRTPPLWGVGLVPVVNGHSRYLHDGRARSLEEAVLWHGGEAKRSREAFVALPKAARESLLFFLSRL